jgi:hypothetical protein
MARGVQVTELRNLHRQLLVLVSRRPNLYTRTGTFWEVVAYIDGYVHGAGYPAGEVGNEIGMGPFGRWLASRTDRLTDSPHWAATLLEHSRGNEAWALEQLAPLYDEYLSTER